ncbi:hypothetical protein GCM10023169_12530 [Georgenia halophila]|uniref:Transposase n=1 Tax=Georgenia halophila TaxID=620889 RepID=A0ABP8KVL3_9MICO
MPSQQQDLVAVANELYGLPLGDFISTRNARAKGVRKEGNTDLAWAIQGLAKPSVAAWLANLMVRQMEDEVDQILELGETLRQAQDELDAAQLRALGQQRRKLLSAVVGKARDLAEEEGQKVSAGVAEQTADTLQAAMADEDAAAALRTGFLVQPMESSGFDSVDLGGVLAVPDALGERGGGAKPAKGGRKKKGSKAKKDSARAKEEAAERRAALERAKEALAEAERTAKSASREQRKHEEKVSKLEARALQLRSEIEELRRQLVEREQTLMSAEDGLEAAEDDRDSAVSAAEEARDAVEEARRTLARLEDKD